MQDRIVVTGLGIISSIGVGKQATLQSLIEERTGIAPVHYLSTSHTDMLVGEVKMSDVELFNSLQIVPNQVLTRTPLLGMIAAREAMVDASILGCHEVRTALLNGTTVGGMEKGEQYYCDYLANKNVDYISSQECGIGTDHIADYLGGFDVVATPSTACSSALNAIIMGAQLIRNGRVDRAVVGGSECLSKFHLNGFNALMIVDEHQCRPFDVDRGGLNLGEGAAYLVIERESVAVSRNAHIYCVLSGCGNSCDAYHQTASSPDGDGAVLAMTRALADGNLQPSDIDYINAHGTGTSNNDESEVRALERVFQNHSPLVSSTKSFTGHTTSAAGSVESVISILALTESFVPTNLNLVNPIHSDTVHINSHTLLHHPLRHVMCNSFGFGGNDSSCVFSNLNL